MTATESVHPQNTGTSGSSKWTAPNVAAILIGLVLFWPVGLFLLVWVAMGRQLRELPGIISHQFNKLLRWLGCKAPSHSGNRIFDEYQQTQYDRIDEILSEIKGRAGAFRDFRDEKRRAADQREFDEFINKKPANGGTEPSS